MANWVDAAPAPPAEKRGVVKKLFRDKGFGFIRVTPEEEYFFHKTGVVPKSDFEVELAEGMEVSFIVAKSKDGRPMAADVRRI